LKKLAEVLVIIKITNTSAIFYPRIILSEELTNTRAAAIGTITITTARKMLLKKALNDGVINRTLNHKLNFNDNYSTRLELQFINLKTCHSSTN
jgi:hypothetical protein